MIFAERPAMLFAVYLTFILANLLMIPLGYLAIRTSTTMIRVRRNVLLAVILFCTIGAYDSHDTLFNAGMMLAKGALDCLFEANGIPVAPIILGLVLGPFLEQNFMISAIKSDWDLSQFFTRPVSGPLGRVDRSCLVLLPADSFVRSWLGAGAGANARE